MGRKRPKKTQGATFWQLRPFINIEYWQHAFDQQQQAVEADERNARKVTIFRLYFVKFVPLFLCVKAAAVISYAWSDCSIMLSDAYSDQHSTHTAKQPVNGAIWPKKNPEKIDKCKRRIES